MLDYGISGNWSGLPEGQVYLSFWPFSSKQRKWGLCNKPYMWEGEEGIGKEK